MSGCRTSDTHLSLSGVAIWTDSNTPKADMHVVVKARINSRTVQLVDDKIILEFPFESAKFAMDPPDWHRTERLSDGGMSPLIINMNHQAFELKPSSRNQYLSLVRQEKR